ncbi:MAG: Gfo/Idh/MocA family oxidoreductase [Halobacteriota archaeon]
MEKLNVGVVGLGKMGLFHAGIFNQLEQSTFIAAAEKDKLTRNLLRAYLPHTTVYSDYEEIFKREELDIAVVTTPVLFA